MDVNLYAVYDEKAAAFNAPFAVPTDALALRSFAEACKDERTDLFKYPGDFKLYCVGYYNTATAMLSPVNPPALLGSNSKE